MIEKLTEIKRLWLILVLIVPVVTGSAALADDYSFDVSAFKPKRLETNFRLFLRPGFSFLNSSSRFFKLTRGDDYPRRFQQNHNLLAGINGHYQAGENSKLHFDGLMTLNSFRGNLRDSHVLNEAYYLFDVDSRLQLGIGKKTFKWGKGYAWNPVNFAGRQKDLNDIDLALAGYSLLYSQYSRSMSGYLSNMTLTMAFLPVLHDLNDDFTPEESFNFVSQLYLLLGNTDVDFYFMGGEGGNHRIAADFSRNLSENHEIHAELAFSRESMNHEILPGGKVTEDFSQQTSFLLGTRYLDRREITYIFEYLHNGSGLGQEEMQHFFDSADLALSGQNRQAMKVSAQNYTEYINRQFVMRDYLYFKASKPELFNDLYLNGSMFTLFNIADKSTSTSFELNYTGQTDQIITLRYTTNLGNANSEFGQKLSSDRVELRCHYFF
jgi:hypothetical protein